MADALSAVRYSYTVILEGGPPWGIRLQGGHEFAQRLRIAKVNPNSKAFRQGVQTGDLVDTINGLGTDLMNHRDALRLFQNSSGKLVLELTRTEKQSAIAILRVESPADLRQSESDLEQVDSFEYLCNDVVAASSVTSCHDNLHASSDSEMTSHGQSSAAIWSPNGDDQMKASQPVLFDSRSRNRRLRTRDDNSAKLSKGYESVDEILISKSFPIPVKAEGMPECSHPLRKHWHPRHISDPGFDSKQSLRPPISDFIQLSRRSRQFNFWNQFYPHGVPDPGVLDPKDDPGNSPSIPNSASHPQVFTSVEEFQKHYGSCYSRTLPLRKRYRPALSQNSTSPNQQTKRVQFAPDELRAHPLFYDSDDAITTFPRVAHPKRKTVSPLAPSDESVKLQNEDLCPGLAVANSLAGESTSPEPGQPNASDNVTSSLKINLTSSSSSPSSSNEDKTEREARIYNRKFTKNESALDAVVGSSIIAVDDDALNSTDLKSPMDTVGTATARLELVRSELPKPKSPILSLLKKNQAETTCNVVQPQTVSIDQQQANGPSTSSIQLKATESQSDPKASHSNITSIRTTAKSNRPVSSSTDFSDQEFLGSMGDCLLRSSEDLGQKDWYKQVFNTLHRADHNSEYSGHLSNAADVSIPPRPKTAQTTLTECDSLCNNHLDERSREKIVNGSAPVEGIDEIAPCGIRYVCKPDRTEDSNTCRKLSADRKECLHSTLPAAAFRSKEVVKERGIAAEDRMLSPRLSDPTLIRDRNSYLFDDKYWLELAGLGNGQESEDQPSLSQSKDPDVPSNKSAATSKAIALYSFKAKSEKELSFNRGDSISIVRVIDKNWYEAEFNGVTGLVPRSYVKMTYDLEEKQEKVLVKVKAKHDFTAKFPAELSFNNRDIITVIRRIDDNWYEGRLDQRTGIFPVSYVEPLSDSLSPVLSSGLGSLSSSAAPPSGFMSSHNVYDDTLRGLSNDVLEFDKLFENCESFDAARTDQKTFVSNNEQSLTLPNAKWTRKPADTKFDTISISSSIRNHMVAPDTIQNSHSLQQAIQSEPRGGDAVRSATPSLHLLYEEPWYQVLYNYTPQHDDELDLREGDLIYLLESCDDGWCVGQSDRTKRFGTFPGNYVKQLS